MKVDNARVAAEKAVAFVFELFGDDKVEHVGLDEIEREEDSWLITVGYHRRAESLINPLLKKLDLPPAAGPRHYKVVVVDGDGEVTAMKNRE